MKKFLVAIFMLTLFAGVCFAEGTGFVTRLVREGTLAYSNMAPEKNGNLRYDVFSNNVWNFYKLANSKYPAMYFDEDSDVVSFFDSISEMLMALNSGRIERIEFPKPVGEYFLNQNKNSDEYVALYYAEGVNDYCLSMGFTKGNKWFESFNGTIKAMNEDGTMLLLKAKYAGKNVKQDELKPIKFENFPDAETVKIAITGDMPPIDYIDADGTAAGFNTAILAEISRRLKINIELVSITTGSRAAALSSGRVDGVFWFWYNKSATKHRDIPENVVLTEPYYSWDAFMYLGKKIK